MRTTILLCFLGLSIGSQAQLINGSFEFENFPSLIGWEWTCGDPEPVNDAAPLSGTWCTTKQPSHAKGCFPSYLYQRLPDLEHGDLITVTGWVKCPELTNCQGGFIGLGRVNNGAFEVEETVSSNSNDWTFLSITDTVEIAEGDTAILMLHSGFTGGPAFFQGTNFDGLELMSALTVPESRTHEFPLVRLSPDRRQLAVNAMPGELIRLFDAGGRVVTQLSGAVSGWRTLPVPEGLTWVLVNVEGNNTRRSQRVVLLP